MLSLNAFAWPPHPLVPVESGPGGVQRADTQTNATWNAFSSLSAEEPPARPEAASAGRRRVLTRGAALQRPQADHGPARQAMGEGRSAQGDCLARCRDFARRCGRMTCGALGRCCGAVGRALDCECCGACCCFAALTLYGTDMSQLLPNN